MNFDSLMGKSSSVWFCVDCDDQAPWKHETMVKCPTCAATSGVMEAKRFTNMNQQNNCQVEEL